MSQARPRRSRRTKPSETALNEWIDVDCGQSNAATSDVIRELLSAVLAAPTPAKGLHGREIRIRDLAQGLELRTHTDSELDEMHETVCDLFVEIPGVRALLFRKNGTWVEYVVIVDPWTKEGRAAVTKQRLALRETFPDQNLYFETAPASSVDSLAEDLQVLLVKETRGAA